MNSEGVIKADAVTRRRLLEGGEVAESDDDRAGVRRGSSYTSPARMSVLAVGAHPDDIELGCGGALLAHRVKGDDVAILVLTKGERGPQGTRPRMREQEDAAALPGARLY